MITTTQYAALLSRLTALENRVNDITTAMNQFMTQLQISEIYTILSAENTALRETVDSLVTRIETVEQESYEDMD